MANDAGTPPAGTPPAGAPPAGTPPTSGFDVTTLNGLQGDAFRAVLPEEVRSKPYVKDINTFSDFVKKFDGAQSLLGQRNIPGENATPQEWDAYFSKTGRPADPNGYNIKEIAGVPKEFLEKAAEVGVIKQALFKAGANSYQAKVFLETLMPAIYNAEKAEMEASEANFAKVMDSLFGANKDAIIANGKKFLSETMPDSVKPLLTQMGDKELGLVFAITDAVMKKYVQEDGFRGAGGTLAGGGGPDTRESLQAAMAEIIKQPEYADPFRDKAKHSRLQAEMELLRSRVAKLPSNI